MYTAQLNSKFIINVWVRKFKTLVSTVDRAFNGLQKVITSARASQKAHAAFGHHNSYSNKI